ncbi:motility associated factor glycosyltransferase family protein [Clostridium amazonitimonense]|uniref:motility associated factor glycosyltransferase family protein n=1 Tax=Clostridium amazonitimonense TaxID=1499689 RepID=UPI000509A089|nr:6-hydroxymethylpterin diphosphokinase MptE-like protein [Clostridium amazonitimonense]
MNYLTAHTLEILKDYDLDKSEIYTERSKDDKMVFRVKYADNKLKYIGSKYYVQKDIEDFFIKLSDINANTLILVLGLGTGQHILKLLDKIGRYNRVLIVEPDKRVLKAFLSLEASKKILEDERISIILYIEEYFKYYLVKFIQHRRNYDSLKIISYANYDKLYVDEYEDVIRITSEVLKRYESNVLTDKAFASKFMHNYLLNIKYISESYILNDLKDKMKGYTAIIVSAGPSLEKNIDKLKQLKNNAVIISGNRTLKPLLEKGITPHFVCSIDCQDIVYDMTKNYLQYKVPLIFSEGSNNKLVKNQEGPKIFFKHTGYKTGIEDIMGRKVDTLYSGGSVAHNSMDFARYLGCDTIIFIGQDLAFTNNKYHADSAKSSANLYGNYENETFEVEAIDGGRILTNRGFHEFKTAFEVYIEKVKDVTFINATEGGANIKGAKNMTLSQTIGEYALKYGVEEVLEDFFENHKINNIDTIKNNIEKNLEELINTNNDIISVRKTIEEFLDYNDLNKIDEYIKKIDKFNLRVEQNKYMNFIDFEVADITNKASEHFRFKRSEDELNNAKNILKAHHKVYGDYMELFNRILPKIEDCINNLF